MTKVYEPLIPFLGLYPSGDLGDFTVYTSKRHALVYFQKTSPKNPPTVLQRRVRARLVLAAWLWQNLPPTKREDWLTAARLAGLRISGYNLFVHWVIVQDDAPIKTIERQTGIDLL